MYYRRKVLLALIEMFGGKLTRIDCQKLLFLFCRYTKQNHYDFFPYRFGGFSFLAYQDKEQLIDYGLLRNSDDFELYTGQSFFNELKPKDQAILKSMSLKLKNVKGKALIRKVYLDYPQYTCRSTILSEMLSQEEMSQVRLWWNTNQTSCLFTIGYQGLTIDAYLNRLISNNVSALVDVRKNPYSMKYGFSKTKLQYYVEKAGLKYFHLPDLGIPSNQRQNLDDPKAYQQLFRYYQLEILPNQTEAIAEAKILASKYKRVAFTCFEADYHFCHRHKVTEYLEETSSLATKVVHL